MGKCTNYIGKHQRQEDGGACGCCAEVGEPACVPAAFGAAAAGAGTFPGWWLLRIVYTSPVLFLSRRLNLQKNAIK